MKRMAILAGVVVFLLAGFYLLSRPADDPLAGCRQVGVNPELDRPDMGGYGELKAYPSPNRHFVAVQTKGSYGTGHFYIYDCVARTRRLVGVLNGFEYGKFFFVEWLSSEAFSYTHMDELETRTLAELFDNPMSPLSLPPFRKVIGESPDGEWELFYSGFKARFNGMGEGLDILRQRGENEVENLTPSLGNNSFIAWSQNGDSFVFSSDRDGMPELYWLNWETLEVRRLTFSIEPEFNVRWEGEMIIYENTFSQRRDETPLVRLSP